MKALFTGFVLPNVPAAGQNDQSPKWAVKRGEQVSFAPRRQDTHFSTQASKWRASQVAQVALRSMKETRVDSRVGKIPRRRKWQPTPVFLPEKFHEQRSLVRGSQRVGHTSNWAGHITKHRLRTSRGRGCARLRMPSSGSTSFLVLMSSTSTRQSWLRSAWSRCSRLQVFGEQLRQTSCCSGYQVFGRHESLKTSISKSRWNGFHPWVQKKPDTL